LATTLHRLRKLLGEEAIERQEGRLTLNPKLAWVDLWVFERQMTALESACRERQHADVARLSDRMLNLYRGGFLAGETDASWALAMRERLRGKCLRLIETTAGCLTRAQHHELALACYQKAIEMDPLAEGFYQGLMRCYHVLGRRAEALTTYRRCQEILDRHLGVVPSPQTEALYQQLLSP
jgi:DNA-binding SARP family transcriptional activator